MQRLFDSLREGIAIVSLDCEVRYTNQIARNILGMSQGRVVVPEVICQRVKGVLQGYAKLPLTLEMDMPGQASEADHLRVTLLQSPVGQDLVVVLHNVSEAQFYEHTVRNLAQMLDHELGEPFRQLLTTLEDLQGTLAAEAPLDEVSRVAAPLTQFAPAVLERLRQLALLAQTWSQTPMLANERVDVAALVQQALILAQPALLRRRISVSMAGLGEKMPSLYGSRQWLALALAEYVRHLAGVAAVGSELTLVVHYGGNFLGFNIRNLGHGIPAHLRDRVFLPFHRHAGSDEMPDLNLGLALCKRVVELHKGHIRLVEEAGEIVEISIELPAGSSREEDEAAGIEQAQRYALDLARLMKRAAGNPRQPSQKAVAQGVMR